MRFGLEEEQKAALYEMNGYMGLGIKSLKICNAVPKPKTAETTNTTSTTTTSNTLPSGGYGTSTTDYSQYYDPTTYWQGYNTASWQGYEQPQTQTDYTAYYQQQAVALQQQQQQQQQPMTTGVAAGSWTHYDHQQEDDDLALVGRLHRAF